MHLIFPHPKFQISNTWNSAKKKCDQPMKAQIAVFYIFQFFQCSVSLALPHGKFSISENFSNRKNSSNKKIILDYIQQLPQLQVYFRTWNIGNFGPPIILVFFARDTVVFTIRVSKAIKIGDWPLDTFYLSCHPIILLVNGVLK